MSAVISVVSAIFWGVIVLSLLVFIHEGGHFLAARAFGMRVTEFFLGMPCRWKLSHKSRTRGTEIGVTPILLGGYTRICGMEGSEDELMAEALALVQQEGRITAEELAHRLEVSEDRAYGMLATLTDWASIRPYYDPEKGEKPNQRDWPAAFETLERDGQMRTEYDKGHDFADGATTAAGTARPVEGDHAAFLEQERSRTYQGHGFLARIITLFAGPLVNLLAAFLIIVVALSVAGFDVTVDSNTIGGVSQGSLAAEVGLQAGDTITSIDGTGIGSWTDLTSTIPGVLSEGKDFELTYIRDGQPQTVEVPLSTSDDQSALGVTAQTRRYKPNVLQSCSMALAYGREVASFAARLIMPQHTAEVVQSTSSIVGISAMASQAAASGALELGLFIAAISMSLGVMNLLPIPPLDGGKILIEIIQAIIRRPLSMKTQTIVSYLGLAFFLVIFCFALRNDLVNIIGL